MPNQIDAQRMIALNQVSPAGSSRPRWDRVAASRPELSVVIPVFNGSENIAHVVEEIQTELDGLRFEIVLVNDGSTDKSEQVCLALAGQYRNVSFVQLDGNFGEHSAVLAGLNHCCGDYVAVMDDDGQNRPTDVRRMLSHIKENDQDVVYVRYPRRHHSLYRILGSWFNDRVATYLLNKPAGLYLSSFKLMNRALVDRIRQNSAPRPYLDGSIMRSTQNIGQITAEHRPRQAGKSGYTIAKLIDLWLSMVVGASVSRIQLIAFAGALLATVAILAGAGAIANWALFTPDTSTRIPFLELVVLLAALSQICALGFFAIYIRCLLVQRRGCKAYVLRYVRHPEGRNPQGTVYQSHRALTPGVIAC